MMSNDQLNLHEEELLVSQLYSANFYTDHVLPPGSGNHVGETRGGRRRRKKNKGDGVNGGKKRKLSEEQVNMLEMNFGNEHKLESERKDRLALELGLDPRQVAVWFQNRRARWKSKKLEEEYSKLKSAHETAIVDKCRLEAEVLKLKGRLSEAEKEIQRLSERSEGMSSPCSSFSMDANSHFLDDYAVEQYDSLFCVPDYSCYVHGSMDYNWSNICGF